VEVVLVPGAAVVVLVPACVVVVVEFVALTVALVFLLSSPVPKISSATRKPTAIASTATSQVLVPLRSIAAAR